MHVVLLFHVLRFGALALPPVISCKQHIQRRYDEQRSVEGDRRDGKSAPALAALAIAARKAESVPDDWKRGPRLQDAHPTTMGRGTSPPVWRSHSPKTSDHERPAKRRWLDCWRVACTGDGRRSLIVEVVRTLDGLLALENDWDELQRASGHVPFTSFEWNESPFARYGVMTTVVAEAMKYAIGAGLRTVNLSTGNDVSKTRWSPRRGESKVAMMPSHAARAPLAMTLYNELRRPLAPASRAAGFPAKFRARGVGNPRNDDVLGIPRDLG